MPRARRRTRRWPRAPRRAAPPAGAHRSDRPFPFLLERKGPPIVLAGPQLPVNGADGAPARPTASCEGGGVGPMAEAALPAGPAAAAVLAPQAAAAARSETPYAIYDCDV